MNAALATALATCVEVSREAAMTQARLTAALEAALTQVTTEVQALTPQAPAPSALVSDLALDEREWDGWNQAEFGRTCTNRALRRQLAQAMREAGFEPTGDNWANAKARLTGFLQANASVENAISGAVRYCR